MTATREHLAGLELARETLNHWPVTGLAAAKLALEQLITEAQSAHEPVQGEDFCDSHCTWLDHQPGCPMHEPVQAEAVHAGFDKTLLRLREATQVHSRGRGSDMATVIKRDLADLLNDYDRIGASYRDQHKRIMAAAKPDAEMVELLRSKFPRIDPCKPVPLDEKAHCCEYTIYVERERLHRMIDAKLANNGGVKP